MEDPEGKGDPIPLCDEHWDFVTSLEKALSDNPEFFAEFSKAVDKAYKATIPTRYERNPVI
jgi:hypothetical protein